MLQKQEVTLNFGSESLFWGPQEYYPNWKFQEEKEMWTTSLPIKISPQMSQTSLEHIFFLFDK